MKIVRPLLFIVLLCSIFIGLTKPATGRSLNRLIEESKGEMKASNSQWPIYQFTPIPFTNFNTKTQKIELEFRASDLAARFSRNGKPWIEFPEKELPIKVLEINEDNFIVISRKLFTGEMSLFIVNNGEYEYSIFPEMLNGHLFKQAEILKNELLVVTYNPVTELNVLHLWHINPDNSLTFDTHFARDMEVSRSSIDAVFQVEPGKEIEFDSQALYFVSDSSVFIYCNTNRPRLNIIQLGGDLDLVELVAEEDNVAAVYNDIDAETDSNSIKEITSYKIINLLSMSSINAEKLSGIPYHPTQISGYGIVNYIKSQSDLITIFSERLQDQTASGLMNLGENNFEGSISNSQIYYLNGFMDLLKPWKDFEFRSNELEELQKKTRQRLDLEIYLLDRLLEDDEIGLKIKRFSINREPVLFATYSARILSLFNRYQAEVISPVSLQNYSKLFQQVISLEHSVEKISYANEDDPELQPGEAFLQFSKGSSFLLDGANVPYSLQNEWATSILLSKGIKNNEEIIQIIRQMVEGFIRNEGIDGSLPENYNWNFWYGHGESGWGNENNISVNRPDFVGDSSTSDNTQKTADVRAILTLGKLYPEILPKDMAAYAFIGIQRGKFHPSLNSEVDALYHKIPGVNNFDLLGKYLNGSNNREVGNRFWGFLYLVNSISREDQTGSLIIQPEQTQPEPKSNFPDSYDLRFAVSLLLIISSSIFLISHIRIESPPAYLIGVYLLGFSQIVLCGEIASLMGRLNSQSLQLLLNLLCVVFALAFWLLAKRPRILGPFHSKIFWLTNFRNIRQSFHDWNFLWIFGFGAGLAFAYTFFLIILVPQNVDDVLTTHLARVGYWLQTGSFYPWRTSSYNLPQVISPANAQILIYWTTLFLGEDKLAAISQWLAAIIAILGIFGICRIMKCGVPKSLFLSLLFITMPSVAIQMSTALTDLIFAALVVACVYLLFLGWIEDNRRILILSSLAFALALGTKQTLLFTLPGFFLTFLALFLLRKTDRVSKIVTWTVAAVIFVGLIGSYFYIQNQIVFGRLLGPAEVESAFTYLEEITIFDRIKMMVAGFFSFSFQTIFSEFFLGYIEFWGGLFDRIFSLFGFTLTYTPLSPLPYSIGTPSFLVFLMILFGLIANVKNGIKKKDPYILGLLSLSLSYLLVLLVIRQFNSAVFRYSILSFALLIPLAAGFDLKIDLSSESENKARRISLYSWIVVLAIAIMGWTILNDGAKPAISTPPIFSMERVKKQTYLMPDFFPVIKSVNEIIPEDGKLGLLAFGNFPQAVLFGKYYSRTVVPIFPEKNGMVDFSQYEAVDYLLIDDDLIKSGLKIPGGFKQITTRLEYNIFEKISESPNFQ